MQQAIRLAPRLAVAHHNLGLAFLARGDLTDAQAAFRTAIAADPRLGGAHLHLAEASYDRNRLAAQASLDRAVTAMPGSGLARFLFSELLREVGEPELAATMRKRAIECDRNFAAWADSRDRLVAKTPSLRRFGSRFSLLDHALANAPAEGLVMEFGVRWGTSARHIARSVDRVHGFDSLEGLPEEWRDGESMDAYSTGGARPSLPKTVTLHPGWFEDTLPKMLASQNGILRLAHIDCDIYSSTRMVLSLLADRISPGTVIVFDEYHSFPEWRDHEFRAFQEITAERSLEYEYLGTNVFGRQAAVRVLSVSS